MPAESNWNGDVVGAVSGSIKLCGPTVLPVQEMARLGSGHGSVISAVWKRP
jgi:hypothetical protein